MYSILPRKEDLLAIETSSDSEHHSIELVAASDHDVKQRWVWGSLSTFQGGFLFSNHGGSICTANSREGKQGPDAACWDTQTGAITAENHKVGVDWNGIASAGGDLLAITDSKYISHQGKLWVFLDMNDDYSVPQRKLLWNVRTGKEIASWSASLYQTELWGSDLQRASKERTPFVLSLSPSGRYVAEGGCSSVSVHAVQP
jgi:hypothetical protein